MSLLLVVVILSLLLALGPLEWGATRDVAGGQLSLETLSIAQSAADELALAFGRLANTPSTSLYRALRSRQGFLAHSLALTWWPIPAAAEAEPIGAHLEATERLVSGLVGQNPSRRFLVVGRSIRVLVQKTDGLALPASIAPEVTERTAEVLFTVTIEGTAAGRTLRRTVMRRQGMRVSRLGLPWPFDSLGLFVHYPFVSPASADPRGILGKTPVDARSIYAALSAVDAQFDKYGVWAEVARRDPGARAEFQRIERLFEPPTYGFPWNDASFFLAQSSSRIDDLSRCMLEPLVGTAVADFDKNARKVQDAVAKLAAQQPPDAWKADLESGLGGMLKAASDFHERRTELFGRFVKVAHDAPVHHELFDPAIPIVTQDAILSKTAWFAAPSLATLEPLFGVSGSSASASNGIILITPSGPGPVELDTAALWGRSPPRAAGRLVVVVDASVRVRSLGNQAATGRRGLVTIVARGDLEVSGHVQANLVARRGLTVAPGATIEGNVYLEHGPVSFGENARLDREPATFRTGPTVPPPDAVHHVAMEPYLSTVQVE